MKRRPITAALLALAETAHEQLFRYLHRTGLIMTALPVGVATIDEVPEAFRGEYQQKPDGKWYPDVPQLNTALETERQRAQRYEREAREATGKLKDFEGIDPVQARAMLSKVEDEGERKLIAEGKLDELRESWLKKSNQDHERRIGEIVAERDRYKGTTEKLQGKVFGSVVSSAVNERGDIFPTAIRTIALLAREEGWQVEEDGTAVQVDRDGQVVLGKDGKTAFQFIEWIEEQMPVHPEWFRSQSSGGGSHQDQSSRGNGSANVAAMAPGAGKLQAARDVQRNKPRARA